MSTMASLQYTLLKKAAAALSRGDVPRIRTLAAMLGAGMWRILPGRRAMAEQTIAARLGVDARQARSIARQSFTQNAQSFLEICLAPHFGFERSDLRVAAPEMLERLRHSGRPLVVTTAHLGAWELSAGLAGEFLADPLPRMIVVRNHGNEAVRRFMFEMRGARGSQIIGHRNAALGALKTLRRNGLVGFLADHNCGTDEAIFLPFLGKVAAVNVGPAVLAVRAQALVWPLFVIRDEHGYVLHTDEPLDTAGLCGTPEERIEATARFYTQAVENAVRAHPEQWFWMHKRWKTRPPSESC